MRDYLIYATCGLAAVLLPTRNDTQTTAGIIRQVQRTRTVTTCEDNCPVTARIEVPTQPAVANTTDIQVGDVLPDGAVVVSVGATRSKTTSVTRTVIQTGGHCQRRAPARRVAAGVLRVATAPLRVANRIRVNRLEARATRGNRLARARCCR